VQIVDEELCAFVTDADRFVTAFQQPMSESAPHIYLSALPFSPMESKVSKVYSKQFTNTLSVIYGRETTWASLIHVMEDHTGWVRSVAFSPDGKRVVSGSKDKTIRIWDAQTGHPVLEPLEGHTGWVWSVAFSPDGKRVVSGSSDNTICIWDAQTGHPVLEPLEGHTDPVLSVAFSPDGKRVVSGSEDRTIRIWDAQTGHPVLEPLKGHTDEVWSVAFSPDGKRVVSGSEDKTICIWDAQTGHHLTPLKATPLRPTISPIETDHQVKKLLVSYIPSLVHGWIQGPKAELICWVPPTNRVRLTLCPEALLVIGHQWTKADLIQFMHGPFWHECKS